MRNEHKKLIREEMHSTDMYCHDLASLSIADILALIEFNTRILEEGGEWAKTSATHFNIRRNLEELTEYIKEFNIRLSNRTVGFKVNFYKDHSI